MLPGFWIFFVVLFTRVLPDHPFGVWYIEKMRKLKIIHITVKPNQIYIYQPSCSQFHDGSDHPIRKGLPQKKRPTCGTVNTTY